MGLAEASGTAGITIAIIAGSFSLAGVLLSILLDKPRRARLLPAPSPTPAPSSDAPLIAELRDQIEQLERALNSCKGTRQRYRDFLIRHNIDIETGERRSARPRRDTPP